MVEAFHAGTLLDHEITDELRKSVAAADEAAAKTRHQREQEEKRIAKKVQGGKLPTRAELTGKSAFIGEDDGDGEALKNATEAARKYSMQIVPNRKSAEFYIHSNPADPGLRTQWASILAGRAVLSTEALVSGRGACCAFLPALSVKRHVYISPGFQAAYG